MQKCNKYPAYVLLTSALRNVHFRDLRFLLRILPSIFVVDILIQFHFSCTFQVCFDSSLPLEARARFPGKKGRRGKYDDQASHECQSAARITFLRDPYVGKKRGKMLTLSKCFIGLHLLVKVSFE